MNLAPESKQRNTANETKPSHLNVLSPLQVHLPSTSTRSVESGNETVTLAPNHGDLFLPNR